MAVEFYIHKMSEHMESAEIIQWLVAEGQPVQAHQAIVEVMTDKFAVELEAPQAGILAGIRPGCVKGATVPVGEPIAFIVQAGETAPVLPPFGDTNSSQEAANGAVAAAGIAESATAVDPEGVGRVRSTPVARRMAKDLGVDIELVRGTGPGGRVVEADIRMFAAARSAQPTPVPPAADVPPLASAPSSVPASMPTAPSVPAHRRRKRLPLAGSDTHSAHHRRENARERCQCAAICA